MPSRYFDFSPLTTRPGILRMCFSAMSFIAVAHTINGVVNSSWIKNKITCRDASCPSPWLVELGLAHLVLSWLYSLVIVIAMTMPKTYKTNLFHTVKAVGYSSSAVLLLTAFVLLLLYDMETLMFSPCTHWCMYSKEYKYGTFKPFFTGAILALFAGILAIYIHRLTEEKKSIFTAFNSEKTKSKNLSSIQESENGSTTTTSKIKTVSYKLKPFN